MITISYGWAAVAVVAIFCFAIAVVLICLSLAAPAFMRWMDDRADSRAERIAEYEAACASAPPPIGADEPTVHIGQLVPIPIPREPEPQLPIELRPWRPVRYGEAPICDSIPMALTWLPDDFGAFTFGAQSWTVPTGAFPVLEELTAEAPPELVGVA